MSEPLVRPITIDDAAAVSDLARQLGYERPPAEIEHWVGATDESCVAFVAESDGDVVGWVEAHVLRLLQQAAVVEIGGLVVGRDLRATGIGRHLMNAAIVWGQERGYGEFIVRSNVVREDAHGFYESIGFRRSKTSHTFTCLVDDYGRRV